MTRRNHRLRERRLNLGKTQYEIGVLAGFSTNYHCAQSSVSYAERSKHVGPATIYKVRSTLVYLESEKRRMREWERKDKIVAEQIDSVIAGGPTHPGYEQWITERLVDLLWDGRGEDFDLLASKVAPDIGKRAGDLYLEQCKPVIPPTCIIELRGPKHLQRIASLAT